jgi:hypothetical protein
MLSRQRVYSLFVRAKHKYESFKVYEPNDSRTTLLRIASAAPSEQLLPIAQHLGRLRNYKSAATLVKGLDCAQLPFVDRCFVGRMMLSAQDGVIADQLLKRTLAENEPLSPSIAVRLVEWIFSSGLTFEEKLDALKGINIKAGIAASKLAAANRAIKYREFCLRRAALEEVDVLEFFQAPDEDPLQWTDQLRYVPHLATFGHQALARQFIERQLAQHGFANAKIVQAALKYDADWTKGDFSAVSDELRETPEFLELAYHQKGTGEGYLRFFESCLQANISRFPTLDVYGQDALLNALLRVGLVDEIEQLANQNPDLPDTMLAPLCAIGMLAIDADKYHDARDCFLRILSEDPSHKTAAQGLRFALPRSGEAIGAISKVRDRIGYGIAGFGRPGVRTDITAEQTTTLLMEGKYKEGLYAKRFAEPWRILKKIYGSKFLNYEILPRTGGRLFLIADEGVGDEVRAIQFYGELAKQFSVTATCDPRLLPMLTRSFPDIRFIGVARRTKGRLNPANNGTYSHPKLSSFISQECAQYLEEADYITFGQNLFFNRFAGELRSPAPGPYLKADSSVPVSRPADKLKVGIIWRSHVRTTWRQLIYLKIEEFASLFEIPDVEFWSLQHAIDDQELAFCRAHNVRQIEGVDLFDDFEGFAPHLASMDVVVGISTLPMELAAAVGTSVWMLGFSPENYFLRTKSGTTSSDQLTCNSTVVAPDWIDFSMPHKECVDFVMNDVRNRLLELSSKHRASA